MAQKTCSFAAVSVNYFTSCAADFIAHVLPSLRVEKNWKSSSRGDNSGTFWLKVASGLRLCVTLCNATSTIQPGGSGNFILHFRLTK